MLPLYLIGNLHCIGMCGPLVMMIGKHRFCNWYFWGRIVSFTVVACFAGAFGSVLSIVFQQAYLSAVLALIFGLGCLGFGVLKFIPFNFTFSNGLITLFKPISRQTAKWMLMDTRKHTFLFGLATVALPCGQSLLVFSACALTGEAVTGALNGAVFALLTSPSLYLAMQSHSLLTFGRKYYDKLFAVCALFAGGLALCRGLADLEVINHLVLSSEYHLVIY